MGNGISHDVECRVVGLLHHCAGVVELGVHLGIGEVHPSGKLLLGGGIGWPDSMSIIVSLHHSLRDIEQLAHILVEVLKGALEGYLPLAEAGDIGSLVGEGGQQQEWMELT